jgi:hypothetical protein
MQRGLELGGEVLETQFARAIRFGRYMLRDKSVSRVLRPAWGAAVLPRASVLGILRCQQELSYGAK